MATHGFVRQTHDTSADLHDVKSLLKQGATPSSDGRESAPDDNKPGRQNIRSSSKNPLGFLVYARVRAAGA